MRIYAYTYACVCVYVLIMQLFSLFTDIDKLLMNVDPFDHQHVTFSDCVAALSPDLVAMLSPVTAVAGIDQ